MYAIEIGDVFADRFRIEAELGHGGMGSVYKATQLALNRVVALKVIAPQFSKNPVFCELFDREASTMAMLDHPNIVAIIDRSAPVPVRARTIPISGVSAIRWLALQYVDGSNVTGLVQSLPAPARLPVEHAVRIVHDVLVGLDYAHGKTVVHQDIKPDNIFIAKETGQVLIGDFGLAKVRAGTVTASILKGTPNYTAPELMQGVPPSAQSDLWSVGAMFWELLTGRLLFAGSSFEECLYAITASELPMLATLGVTVPPGVEHVVRQLLARSRSDRYLTAADAHRELVPHMSEPASFRRFIRATFGLGDPVAPTAYRASGPDRILPTTGALAAGQRATAPRSRRTRRTGALVVALGALVAGGGAALVLRGTSSQESPRAAAAPRPVAPPPSMESSSSQPAPVAVAVVPPPPATASITIDVSPADAVVTVDAKAIDGAGTRHLSDIELHKRVVIHVERAGYQPYERALTVDADVLLPVQLTALPPPVATHRGGTDPVGPLVITPGGPPHRGTGPSVVSPR